MDLRDNMINDNVLLKEFININIPNGIVIYLKFSALISLCQKSFSLLYIGISRGPQGDNIESKRPWNGQT